MSPVIYSPVSPQGSFLNSSFGSMPFSPSDDSLCPLISSGDDTDHPSLFDTYISSMVEKDMHYAATGSTSDLSDGSRSSMDEGAIAMSPSQGTIKQEPVRPHKVKKKRSLGDALKAFKSPSHGSLDSPSSPPQI